MNNIKQDGWRNRADLVQLDWEELCKRHDYQLGNVLKPEPNVSQHKIDWLTITLVALFLFCLSVVGAVCEMSSHPHVSPLRLVLGVLLCGVAGTVLAALRKKVNRFIYFSLWTVVVAVIFLWGVLFV